MKKIALVLCFATLSVFAQEPQEDRVVTTQLCDYWRYNFDIREYVCGTVGRRVRLVEARDYEATINTLEARIGELERRLEQR